MTSTVSSYTFTVSHADVLYVTQQMARDLRALREAYPEYINADDVLAHQDSLTTFVVNDAVERVGFSILAQESPFTVYHELRYQVGYGEFSERTGQGGKDVVRRWIPAPSKFRAWVVWSDSMIARPLTDQLQIVESTLWGPPGGPTFKGTYAGGTLVARETFRSGILFAECGEYFND